MYARSSMHTHNVLTRWDINNYTDGLVALVVLVVLVVLVAPVARVNMLVLL